MTAGSAAYPPGRDETAQRLHVLYERKRYQRIRAGHWAPFTSTAPVRDHLEFLRESGTTQGEISRQSGVSATAMSRAAKHPRIPTAAAETLLAVQPLERTDEQPATQALRSLVADGWTHQQLADASGLTVRTVGRTVNGHTTPTPGSTAAIIDALDQLRLEDPGDRAAAVWARNRAAQAGWDPATPSPDRADIDDVAVERVVDGSVVPLRPAEQQAALQRLAGHHSDAEIARRLGLASRTVLRHRHRETCRPTPRRPHQTDQPDDHSDPGDLRSALGPQIVESATPTGTWWTGRSAASSRRRSGTPTGPASSRPDHRTGRRGPSRTPRTANERELVTLA